MNLKNFSFLSLTALSLALWTSCTVENADKEIAMPCDGTDSCEDEKEAEVQEPTIDEQEMQENYFLLSVFYIGANEKLLDINSYIGHGEEAGYSPDYYEFPDIYYMYSQMGDYYTRYYGPYYAKKYDFDDATDPIYDLAISIKAISNPCDSTSDSTSTCKEDDSRIVVSQIYPGGPGDKAGLKGNDTILYVGASSPGDAEGFSKLTSGKEGDKYTLKVLRGSDTLDVVVELFCYLKPTVYISYHDSIPVIKITEYEDYSGVSCLEASNSSTFNGTAIELKKALDATKGATIIDLRGNPGGSFDQCVGAAEQLLSKGDTIAILDYTDIAPDGEHQMILTDRIVATEDGAGKGRYYVFLADTSSASCAETMLMAVTQNIKSPIVGLQTYGKGIGQYQIATSAGGVSMITSMKLYDKHDVSYHDVGLLPDYEIADSQKALDKAAEIAKIGKEKRTKGYGTKKLGHFNNSLAKRSSFKNGELNGGAYRVKKSPWSK